MPFAGHAPIHPRWSEHHRPTATGTHTATCVITRDGGDGTLDGDNVWHPSSTTTIYTGSCRLTSQGGSQVLVVGEQPVAVRSYLLTIEWDADPVYVHDIVEITSSEDPGAVGLKLRVTDARHASEIFERVLACSDDLTNREA